jgi:hypothetical protein
MSDIETVNLIPAIYMVIMIITILYNSHVFYQHFIIAKRTLLKKIYKSNIL